MDVDRFRWWRGSRFVCGCGLCRADLERQGCRGAGVVPSWFCFMARSLCACLSLCGRVGLLLCVCLIPAFRLAWRRCTVVVIDQFSCLLDASVLPIG